VVPDDRPEDRQEGVEEAEVVARAHVLREGREVADIEEEDGHLALGPVPELDLEDVVLPEESEELARNEPLQRGVDFLEGVRVALGYALELDLAL
jgi:hypothetical protein